MGMTTFLRACNALMCGLKQFPLPGVPKYGEGGGFFLGWIPLVSIQFTLG